MVTLSHAQLYGLAAMMVGLCALSAIVAAAWASGSWRPRWIRLRRLADLEPIAGDLEADAYPAPELSGAFGVPARLEPLPPPSAAQAATTAAERAAAYDQLAPAALDATAAARPPCRWDHEYESDCGPGCIPLELRGQLPHSPAQCNRGGRPHPGPCVPPMPEPPRSADWERRPDPGAAGFTSCAARYDSAMSGIMARLA